MKFNKFNPHKNLLIIFLLIISSTFCLEQGIHALPILENEEQSFADTYLTNSQENLCTDPSNAHAIKAKLELKDWTFITYMAADNDLAPFARKNLKEQSDVGSSKYINIVTQLDTRVAGNKKVTKRYYIEKNKLIVTNQNDPNSQKMDSGLPATLIDCCKWAITNYPAKNYVLILWNHGTGALDVVRHRSINPLPLFMFNPESNLLELDRSISFIDFVQATCCPEHRSICFDDSTGHALNNQDLDFALSTICKNYLGGKKFSIICFDACLMSMIEIANIVKNHAHYMTASVEVELGTGYNYYKILLPFLNESMEPKAFAKHIVKSYENAYSTITNDYTQSAIDLSGFLDLEITIDRIAELLIEAIKIQKNNSVREAIKLSRHKLYCTHFDEPSYLDWHHLCTNLLANSKKMEFTHIEIGNKILKELQEALRISMDIVKNIVIENVAGKNLIKTQGISIYFPERRIHQSYQKTKFAQSNKWFTLIRNYLAA
jgi:hypothetical protein